MATRKAQERKRLPLSVVTTVLTESGYRCAVPTCRGILALDMHHIWQVSAGGGDEAANLIALCPTCHALLHRGTMAADSIYVYKAMLVALSNAFDFGTIDLLLLLRKLAPEYFLVSSDGLIQFARLVSAGLVQVVPHKGGRFYHRLNLTDKGAHLVAAWEAGDRSRLAQALGEPSASPADSEA